MMQGTLFGVGVEPEPSPAPWVDATWRLGPFRAEFAELMARDPAFLRSGWALGRWGVCKTPGVIEWCWQLDEITSGKRVGLWPTTGDQAADLRALMSHVERLYAASQRWGLLPLAEVDNEFFDVIRPFRSVVRCFTECI